MKNLKSLRRSSKLTQQQLADALGIERASVARYEDGSRTPPLKVMLRIADFFDTSLDYLTGREDDTYTPETFDVNITDIAAHNSSDKSPLTREQVNQIVQSALDDFKKELRRKQ